MALKHPDFPHIDVQVSSDGEAPHEGAFYAPKKNENLSGIATALIKMGRMQVARQYDGVMLINNAKWNRTNCVYRESSTDCRSKKVTKGGYITICQSDANSTSRALGLKYPVIWIPSSAYAEPEDVVTGPTVFMPVGKVLIPNKKITPTLPKQLGLPGTIAQKEELPSYVYASGGTGAQAITPAPESSSTLMWVGIIIAIAAAGGILYATTRSGGKRR